MVSNRYIPPLSCGGSVRRLLLVDTDGSDFVRLDPAGCSGCSMESTRFRHFVWDRFTLDYTYFVANSGLYRLNMPNLGNYELVADLPNPTRIKYIYSYTS